MGAKRPLPLRVKEPWLPHDHPRHGRSRLSLVPHAWARNERPNLAVSPLTVVAAALSVPGNSCENEFADFGGA
jgi:hypothetical protein